MKKMKFKLTKKNYIVSFLAAVLIIMLTVSNVYAVPIYNGGNIPIVINGYFDDWSDKPYSWEYVWNNPNDYWENGEHIYATDTDGSKYNDVVRHKMSLLCDGEYIYLYIKMAKNWYTSLNGTYYQFFVDGEMSAFYLTTMNGSSISQNSLREGINEVLVRHVRTGLSGSVAAGSKAYVFRRPGGINDELELKIPLTALKAQTPSTDIEHFKSVQFFSPDLMYRKITSSTTSTYPYILILLSVTICIYGFYKMNKKGMER